jgi:hypothetical protein
MSSCLRSMRYVSSLAKTADSERQSSWIAGGYSRWSDAAAGNDKVIVLGHAPCSFDDLAFVIRNHFYAF